MKRFTNLLSCLFAFGFAFTLASCGSDDSKTITIIASPTPHAEVLENAVAPLVKEAGYTLDLEVADDYVTPNKSVDDGSAFANYFQHVPYLNEFNEENGTDVVPVFGVHYEPFGIYAGKTKSLDSIPDGAQIGVPNDATNEARALLLLQDNGVLTLKDGVGINATKADIESNPHNVQIEELEAAAIADQLESLDFGVINGNYALENNLGDALVYESTSSDAATVYNNVVAIKSGNEDDPRVQVLEDAFQDDSVKQYFSDNYGNAVVYKYIPKDELYQG